MERSEQEIFAHVSKRLLLRLQLVGIVTKIMFALNAVWYAKVSTKHLGSLLEGDVRLDSQLKYLHINPFVRPAESHKHRVSTHQSENVL